MTVHIVDNLCRFPMWYLVPPTSMDSLQTFLGLYLSDDSSPNQLGRNSTVTAFINSTTLTVFITADFISRV